jgi:hypothetical protein
MKDNGKMIIDMVKVLYIIRMVKNLMVTGLMIKVMDMECFTMQMEIGLKVSGKMIKEMVKE